MSVFIRFRKYVGSGRTGWTHITCGRRTVKVESFLSVRNQYLTDKPEHNMNCRLLTPYIGLITLRQLSSPSVFSIPVNCGPAFRLRRNSSQCMRRYVVHPFSIPRRRPKEHMQSHGRAYVCVNIPSLQCFSGVLPSSIGVLGCQPFSLVQVQLSIALGKSCENVSLKCWF